MPVFTRPCGHCQVGPVMTRAKETMKRNVVLLSKTIVAQHFKLLTRLCHSRNFKFLSSSQHAYCNCREEVAAITVKLLDQTLLADMEMLYIKLCLACGMELSLWSACTPVLLHWPPHCTGRCICTDLSIQDATAPVCSPACDVFIKTQATPLWSAW
jgi:hypothetical protein